MTTKAPDGVVRLRRFWDRPSEARCHVSALHDLLWTNHRTLGERAWFGPSMMTALVSCDEVRNVDDIHLAGHGDCPHTIRVIIAGVDNPTRTYRSLRRGFRVG